MKVLAVHDGMVPYLERGGIDRANVEVLRNPVMPWCSERVRCEENRSFLFVGRLESDKGVDLLAAAARKAGIHLQVVGQGPLGELLSKQYQNVEQLGWKSRTEIAELVGNARVLVMPTRSRESFGLVALEALTSGVPIVVSENAMIAGEVVSNGMGLSCNPLDFHALADTLSLLAADDDLVSAMSHRAYETAHTLAPTPAEWTDALLRVYGGIITDSARTPAADISRREGGLSAVQLRNSTMRSGLRYADEH